MPVSVRLLLLPSVALAVAAACGRGTEKEPLADTVGAASRLAVVTASVPPYRIVTVSNPGKVTGTVVFTGTPPGDTLIQVAADQNGCGKPLTINRLQRSNGLVAGVLVWISDIHAGRALPLNKRFELTNNDCAWDPVVQGTLAGGTLNIINYDPLADRAFITSVATRDTVAIAPFTDNGQLIPYDKLLRTPGVYELSVESRPMSRAWVAVLDHPYFAVTDAAGAFTLDSVPAGTYTVRAWHPMLGVANAQVTVASNATATVTLQYPTAAP